MIHWINITSTQQLDQIINDSATLPQVIFKHSTRCSISNMAKARLERAEAPADIPFYYLDLLQNRALSQEIAHYFKVQHESPQILLIKSGQCSYNASHNGVNMEELMEQL